MNTSSLARKFKSAAIHAAIPLMLAAILCAPAQADRDRETYETLSRRSVSTAEDLRNVAQDRDNMIAWRKYAENKLKNDPNSIEGLAVMGVVLHKAEGDLPGAKRCLDKAKRLLRRRGRDSGLLLGVYMELSSVLGEMDAYSEKISMCDEAIKTVPSYSVLFMAEKAWPLMKLNRTAEAKKIIDRLVAFRNPEITAYALNTLGSIESEEDNYQSSYKYFEAIINELENSGKEVEPTIYRNLGETCLTLGRFREAEQLFIKASNAPFSDEIYTNPYHDLTALYISEARFPEAASSLQKTYEWSRSLRPFLYQQFMADNLQVTGEFLLEIGRIPEAANILHRLINRPDRQGGSSIDSDQAEAGNLLTWYAALTARRECLREELSWSSGWKALKIRWNLLRENYEIWCASSRIRALIVENGRISASLRPYNSQSVTASECYKPMLIKILGPGVCTAALDEKAEKTPANFPVEEPYWLMHRAEIAYQFGNMDTARKNFEKSLATLPKEAVLVRSFASARLAEIAQRSGDIRTATDYCAALMAQSPTALRRVNMRVPIVCHGDSSEVCSRVIGMLKHSPRFKVSEQGLALQMGLRGNKVSATILGPNQRVLAEASVKLDKNAKVTAQNLAAEIHNQAFAVKINLGSLDLNSLDGSNSAGSTARKRMDELLGGDEDTGETI